MDGGRTSSRILLGAVAAALLLALPAGAAASSHNIVAYKVEKHGDLDAATTSASVECSPGDYAPDGMWRLDHVDQDNSDPGGTPKTPKTKVKILEARLTAKHRYDFHFAKSAPGRAQAAELSLNPG